MTHTRTQSRWVARVLSGRAPSLPSEADMRDDIAAFEGRMQAESIPLRYLHNQVGAGLRLHAIWMCLMWVSICRYGCISICRCRCVELCIGSFDCMPFLYKQPGVHHTMIVCLCARAYAVGRPA